MSQVKQQVQADIDQKYTKAACKIQKMWRNYTAQKNGAVSGSAWSSQTRSLLLSIKRRNQLVMIQKFMRGYIVYEKLGK